MGVWQADYSTPLQELRRGRLHRPRPDRAAYKLTQDDLRLSGRPVRASWDSPIFVFRRPASLYLGRLPVSGPGLMFGRTILGERAARNAVAPNFPHPGISDS